MNLATFEQLARWGRPNRPDQPNLSGQPNRSDRPNHPGQPNPSGQPNRSDRADCSSLSEPWLSHDRHLAEPGAVREWPGAPAFYCDPMTGDQHYRPLTDGGPRPHPLRGFWALIGGGLVITAVIVALDPITRQEDCPNYHAAGNASAFADPVWDLNLTVMGLGWIALTTLEQFLPVTHRGWNGWFGAIARAMIAITLSVVGCCCLIGRLLIMCH